MLSVVSYKTYKKFAKKYKIKLTRQGLRPAGDAKAHLLENKSLKKLSSEIKDYEYEHNITNGLYY